MFEKVSWIIPTMWKHTLFFRLLDKVSKANNGDEVIVIDNVNSNKHIKLPNVRQVFISTNSFVNPAWNLGVSLSHNEAICLVNDDVMFTYEVYRKQLLDALNEDEHSLLLSYKRRFYNIQDRTDEELLRAYPVLVDPVDSAPGWKLVTPEVDAEPDEPFWGTGFVQGMAYKHYPVIPAQLRIFFGDNWIREVYKANGWRRLLSHCKIVGRLNGTVSTFNWDSIGRDKGRVWEGEVDYYYGVCAPKFETKRLY